MMGRKKKMDEPVLSSQESSRVMEDHHPSDQGFKNEAQENVAESEPEQAPAPQHNKFSKFKSQGE